MTSASVPSSVPDSLTSVSDSPESSAARDDALSRRSVAIWLAVLAALCLWTAHRLGAFGLQRTVATAAGTVPQANTFSSIDNPFHAARAALLLDTLKHGEVLRWIGSHQGGYPVEFYPLGVAWIEVGIWGLFLGMLPILAVHKLAVILIFLLPVAGFWVLARTDRLTPGIAVLALAGQIAIPGGIGLQEWTSGGYTELVTWGLVTNVAGATFAMVGVAFLVRVVLRGGRWAMLGAIAAITLSTYANPRSLAGVVVGVMAVVVGIVWMMRGEWRTALARIAVVGAVTLLLCMPILLSLVRYEDLYIFLHYQSYENVQAYLTTSARTVSPPVLVLAVAGVVIALCDRRYPAARMTALALTGYVLVTGILSVNQSVIAQLETPRLMPFQRFLTLYLAAWAVWWLVDRAMGMLAPQGRAGTRWVADGVLALVGVAMLVACLLPWGAVPVMYRGLPPTPTTGTTSYADFAEAVTAADGLTPDGEAMLVLGTIVGDPIDLGGTAITWDWHGSLLAPTKTKAPLLYNDWLWDWHEGHAGTPGYNFENGHTYPDPANALEASYLQEHGIGTLVVTNVATQQLVAGVPNPDPREAARANPNLTFQKTFGAWDVYIVNDPTSLVTDGGNVPSHISVENGRIEATFENGSGEIVIRQNWFPRWQATVNGKPVDVERGSDSAMHIAAPAGKVELTLVYAVTAWDWFARIAAGLGAIAAIGIAIDLWPRVWLLVGGATRSSSSAPASGS
ncbi:MAG: hypothetical protein QM589_10555 [Thermomicrobiales bacterium]